MLFNFLQVSLSQSLKQSKIPQKRQNFKKNGNKTVKGGPKTTKFVWMN